MGKKTFFLHNIHMDVKKILVEYSLVSTRVEEGAEEELNRVIHYTWK